MHKLPKLLVIGHARHGKDTVCECLRDVYGHSFISSSEFVGREVLYDILGGNYKSFKEMFDDRHNHRKEWFDAIAKYNTPDGTKTARGMLDKGHNIYCGMRKRSEFEACKEANIFDQVVWIDRSEHLPEEPVTSMELVKEDADLVIDNNGDLKDLYGEIYIHLVKDFE